MAPLRADARRNRERIIAAAKVAFAEAGLDVSMDAIAREAGVGIGTLYRRFQDRDELIVAVAAHTFRAVLVDARAAVGAEPSAWDAFVRLVMRSDELRLAVHLAFQSPQVWKTVHHAPESRDVHREMIAVLDRLVEAARNEGSIRADIGSGDAMSIV
jgi:AcrR family transcriptional regulator